MGGMKPASLVAMPLSRHGAEVSGKQGDITAVLLLGHDATPETPLDPAVAAALTPPLVASLPDGPADAASFFARCARRIRRFAQRQARRAGQMSPGG